MCSLFDIDFPYNLTMADTKQKLKDLFSLYADEVPHNALCANFISIGSFLFLQYINIESIFSFYTWTLAFIIIIRNYQDPEYCSFDIYEATNQSNRTRGKIQNK